MFFRGLCLFNKNDCASACVGLGVSDPKLAAIGRAGRSSKPSGCKHICRNFHKYLEREKRLLQVNVRMVKLRVRVHRPRVEELDLDYPFIGLEDWAKFLLEHHPKFLLGGWDITEKDDYTEMFARFWERYKALDEHHPIFSSFSDFSHCIPYCVHGDEGRGKSKTPVLITSYQMLIGYNGEQATNMNGRLDLIC